MRNIKTIALLLLGLFIMGCSPKIDISEQESLLKVGVLVGSEFRLVKVEGLEETLKEYGFQIGDNLQLVIKNAQGDQNQLTKMAKELIQEKVDVIVTTGRVETEAAKAIRMDKKPPIVFLGLTGLKENGLVQNLLHPWEGITGVNNDHAALSGKRLELLTKLLPTVKSVLVVYDPSVTPAKESLTATREAATCLDIAILEAPVSSKEAIGETIEQWGKTVDAILVLPSVFLESAGLAELIPLATALSLPIMGVEHSDLEGLFGIYGITPYDQGAQGARILAKILMGQEPEEIPVEPPAKLKLTVDLSVAEKMGLELNKNMLGFAELIYEEGGDNTDP